MTLSRFLPPALAVLTLVACTGAPPPPEPTAEARPAASPEDASTPPRDGSRLRAEFEARRKLPRERWWDDAAIAEAVAVQPAQRERLDAHWNDLDARGDEAERRAREAEREAGRALRDGDLDAARAAAQRHAEAERDRVLARHQLQIEIAAVLQPEQRRQLAALQAERQRQRVRTMMQARDERRAARQSPVERADDAD